MRILAGISIAGGVVACSVLTSLGGLSGGAPGDGGTGSGPDGEPVSDASGSSNEDSAVPTADDGGDSTSSVPSDSGAPGADGSDAGGGADAATDASQDAGSDAPHEAAASPYCASLFPAPLFCDDFDEGALASPWDQVTKTSGAATLDTTYSVSPADSMLASVNASANANNIDVAAYKSFSAKQGVAGLYTMAFDVRVDAADMSANSSDATLGGIQLWNGSAWWDLALEIYNPSAAGAFAVSLTENDSASSNTTHTTATTFLLHTWTRVSITLVLPPGSGGAAPATMSFNGTPVVSATVHVTPASVNPGVPEVVLGVQYATPASSGWAVRYDNVTFD